MVVNFPSEKRTLLPPDYLLADLEDALSTESVVALIDEGTTQLPAGNQLENFIKGCSSLSRQREQIIIFIFHATRDIGSRILRGIDTVMIKKPSRRQIQQGSKDKWLMTMLETAKGQIEAKGGDPCIWTYVDAEDPDFSGLMSNPLPSFWSQELSTAWKGVGMPGAKLKSGRHDNTNSPEVLAAQLQQAVLKEEYQDLRDFAKRYPGSLRGLKRFKNLLGPP
jgi:hypothetical protein